MALSASRISSSYRLGQLEADLPLLGARSGPAPASCRRWPAARRAARWPRTAARAPAPPRRCWAIERQDRPVALDGRLGVGQLALVGPGQRRQQRQRRAGPSSACERLLVGRHQVGPAAGLGRQPLGVLARPARPAGSSENACRAITSAAILSPTAVSSSSARRCIRSWRPGGVGGVRQLHRQDVGQPGARPCPSRRTGSAPRPPPGCWRRAAAPARRPSGPGRLVQAIAVQLPDLVPQPDLGLVVLGLGLALEHAHELVPLALGGVEALERVPVLLLDVQLAKRVLGPAVVRLGLQQRPPGADRLADVLQLLGVQQRQLQQAGRRAWPAGSSCVWRSSTAPARPRPSPARTASPARSAPPRRRPSRRRTSRHSSMRDRRLLQLLGGQPGHLDAPAAPLVGVGDAARSRRGSSGTSLSQSRRFSYICLR